MEIAEQTMIKDLFASKRRSEVKIPSEKQLATWNIGILVDYVKTKLSPTVTLSLEQLQLKTILLLCMSTMWRPRSDIGRLQYRDIIFKKDDTGGTSSVRIHSRNPKEGPVKSTILGELSDEDMCTNSTSVKPTTVANWVKTAMAEAGIDTKDYQAHSIRAASSTKAVELGHSIQEERITFDVGVEETKIGLGTTTNTQVDETTTENVIHPNPWYKRIFG
ncbi:hypothetical protein [Parasitella parasitica]|uniref:Tyr recombinase domain-containing protein n=1 Tax=Parasitella parasitica TaxID=35722 RepID=A0A0B7MUB9_9FUNG|nr:hypothetical protein [Parasitella parasitica]